MDRYWIDHPLSDGDITFQEIFGGPRFFEDLEALAADDPDVLGRPDWTDEMPIQCRRHGFWSIPRSATLANWEKARKSGRIVHKLDQTSEWRNTDFV